MERPGCVLPSQNLRLLSLSHLLTVFRCVFAGFVFESVMTDYGKGWGASITKWGFWDWVRIEDSFYTFVLEPRVEDLGKNYGSSSQGQDGGLNFMMGE